MEEEEEDVVAVGLVLDVEVESVKLWSGEVGSGRTMVGGEWGLGGVLALVVAAAPSRMMKSRSWS